MRKAVTLSLPWELYAKSAKYCKKSSVKMSEMAREAIRDYLFKRELEEIRKTFTAHLNKRGIFTERDLMKALEK